MNQSKRKFVTIMLFILAILCTASFTASAMDNDSNMMMDKKDGKAMMQDDHEMSPDEMIEKGEMMIEKGKEMKMKGMQKKKMMMQEKQMMEKDRM